MLLGEAITCEINQCQDNMHKLCAFRREFISKIANSEQPTSAIANAGA